MVTGPGTIEDLIADAETAGFAFKPRTVHEWVRAGLLDRPEHRGKGRGSHPGVFAMNQRKLFLLLLYKRAEMPRIPADPAPAVAHLASYEAWAEQCGVPFEETVARARELVVAAIATEGSFRINCLGGILVCRP